MTTQVLKAIKVLSIIAARSQIPCQLTAKMICAEFPRGIESIELWNRFSTPGKSIVFGQNVHKVLKKYGNSKFNHLSIQILLFTADDSSADVSALCSTSKIFEKRS